MERLVAAAEVIMTAMYSCSTYLRIILGAIYTSENFWAERGHGVGYCLYILPSWGGSKLCWALPWRRIEHGSHSMTYHLTSFRQFENSGSVRSVRIMADRGCVWSDHDVRLPTQVWSKITDVNEGVGALLSPSWVKCRTWVKMMSNFWFKSGPDHRCKCSKPSLSQVQYWPRS